MHVTSCRTFQSKVASPNFHTLLERDPCGLVWGMPCNAWVAECGTLHGTSWCCCCVEQVCEPSYEQNTSPGGTVLCHDAISPGNIPSNRTCIFQTCPCDRRMVNKTYSVQQKHCTVPQCTLNLSGICFSPAVIIFMVYSGDFCLPAHVNVLSFNIPSWLVHLYLLVRLPGGSNGTL